MANIYGTSGDDSLNGTTSNDYISGDAGNDSLFGDAGNDTIYAGTGNDTIDGGAGDDWLYGGDGDDRYLWSLGSGNDSLQDSNGTADTINFGSLNSTDVEFAISPYLSDDGIIVKIKSTGETLRIRNWLTNDSYKIESFQFADTTLTASQVQTLATANGLNGTEGNDTIYIPSSFSTVTHGNGGNDTIIGGSVAQTIYGDDGNDWVYGGGGNDTIYGGAGNDYLYGGSGANSLDGGIGDDYLGGGDGNDTLQGGAGNDTISGGSGSDSLLGGDNDDTLNGDAGNDTLQGGSGNDTLRGGDGNDTYVWGTGVGNDVILEANGTADTVNFGTLKSTDVTFAISPVNGDNGIIVTIKSTGETLRIQNWFAGSQYQIENFKFADRTINARTVQLTATGSGLKGTEGDDTIYTPSGFSTVVYGLGGNDTINISTAPQTVYAGDGNDSVNGGAGNDTIYGGAGNDSINGGAGDNILYGESGNDYLKIWDGTGFLYGGEGNDTLQGYSGNDLLSGDAGDDLLLGDFGNDSYVWNSGSGNDVIHESYGVDTINFGTLNSTDVDFDMSLLSNKRSIVIENNITGETLEVLDWLSSSDYIVENLKFSDITLTAEQVGQIVSAKGIWGTGSGDMIYTPNTISTVTHGNGGNDTIYGSSIVQTIYGDDGNDTIYGNTGDIIAYGGTGDDDIYGGTGDDNIIGEAGNDVLRGGAGNDTLSGGSGSDLLFGESGNDTYIWTVGNGDDVIQDIEGTTDTINFGSLNSTDIIFSIEPAYYETGILVKIVSTGETLSIKNWFYGSEYQIENFQFADGVLNALQVEAIATANGVVGTEGNDNIHAPNNFSTVVHGLGGNDYIVAGAAPQSVYGGAGNDTIYGEAGSDSLYGGDGNNTIEGGVGNDTIYGGSGNDTYIWGFGLGNDTILETSGTDTVDFGTLASADVDFLLSRDNSGNYNDLLVSVKDTGETLRIRNWFSYDGYKIEYFQFTDTVLTAFQIQDAALVNGITGTEGNDTISAPSNLTTIIRGLDGDDYIAMNSTPQTVYGGSGNDTVYGGSGNDTIYGEDGNDTIYGNNGMDILDGGSGNDSLSGGAGDDTYIWGTGYGNDVVGQEAGGNDTINFGTINSADVEFSLSSFQYDPSGHYAGGILVRNINTGETIRINDWFTSDSYKVENFQFADTTLTAAEIETMALANGVMGSDGDDTINASYDFGTTVYGKGGNDYITIENAVRTVYAGAGDDTVYGSTGNDTIYGGAGDDNLHGNLGDNVISGDEGNDYITVYGTGNNSLYGGAGNDTLSGSMGNDLLAGEIGDDSLLGGDGDDTYVFTTGVGNDIISDSSGNDTINFSTMNSTDVQFSISPYQGDNGIIVTINGTGETLRIQNWSIDNEYQIESFQFADTMLTAEDVKGMLGVTEIYGTNGSDTLVAAANTNTAMYGLWGDDLLYGNTGNDTLDGGGWNDTMYGGTGNDTYYVNFVEGDGSMEGPGNDVIRDSGGNDTIRLNNISHYDVQFSISPYYYEDDSEYGGVSDNGIVMSINGTDDVLLIQDWFTDDEYMIENFEFADGIYTGEQIMNDAIANGLVGTADDDFIYAPKVSTDIYGMSGNDAILIGNTAQSVFGGDGNDTILALAWDDSVSGNHGTDSLYGGTGNDIYIFEANAGDGNIFDEAGNDTIDFGDLNSTDVTFAISSYSGDDGIVVKINSTGDTLRIKNYFTNDSYKIENFQFADTTLTASQVQDLIGPNVINGTEGNDDLYGPSSLAVSINGLGESDTLSGGLQNDTLDGGAGNDYLFGGYGDDSYLYTAGSGNDAILDYYGNNTIDFGALSSTDVEFGISHYAGDDGIVMTINNTGETLRIQNWFAGDEYKIQNFLFADTTLTASQVQDLIGPNVINGTEGNDELYGPYSLGVAINGLGGNDLLCGGNNSDTLNGGLGEDTLYGSYGDDTYINTAGEGNSIIYDAGGNDSINFGSLNSTDVQFSISPFQDDNGILLTVNGTGETIRIQSWFESDEYRIDNFQFADTTLTASTIESALTSGWIMGTEYDDALNGPSDTSAIISGKAGDDVLTGGTANDIIYGGDGYDSLYGSAGNDSLSGGTGEDFLSGGTGNDTLNGGEGGDTYFFSAGDGNDLIADNGFYDEQNGVQFDSNVLMNTVALYQDGDTLYIGYGDSDVVAVADQQISGISTIDLDNGFYLNSESINLVIQEINAFAADQGIILTSIADVKANQDLMNIVAEHWQLRPLS